MLLARQIPLEVVFIFSIKLSKVFDSVEGYFVS